MQEILGKSGLKKTSQWNPKDHLVAPVTTGSIFNVLRFNGDTKNNRQHCYVTQQ